MKSITDFTNNIITAGVWVQVPISSTHICELRCVSSDLPFFIFYANTNERCKTAEQ